MLSLIPPDISPYTLLYNALRLAGLTNKDGRPWSLIYSTVQVILITVFLILAAAQVFLGNEELEVFVLTFSSLVDFIQVYVKLLAILANEKKIEVLIRRLSKYRSELLNDVEYEDQIFEADQKCRKYAKYYSSLFISFPLYSFISNYIYDYSTSFQQPHLTHELYIPWNMNEFWRYTAASVFVTVMTLSGCIIYTACGILQFTFTFQMSAYLRILLHRLETKGAKDATIYKHHNELNQFLQAFNEIYSGAQFVEITVASLMPCGYGYAIIRGFKRNEPASLLVYYSFLLCMVGPFIICYCGQEINAQMERLHEGSYMSTWYEEKPKVRRDLYTMMLVTVRPLTVNYRLFVTYNYECFAAIIQGIYSYLMMINNFEIEG